MINYFTTISRCVHPSRMPPNNLSNKYKMDKQSILKEMAPSAEGDLAALQS